MNITEETNEYFKTLVDLPKQDDKTNEVNLPAQVDNMSTKNTNKVWVLILKTFKKSLVR